MSRVSQIEVKFCFCDAFGCCDELSFLHRVQSRVFIMSLLKKHIESNESNRLSSKISKILHACMLHAIFSLTRTQSLTAATVAAFFTSVVITALITLLAPFYCIPRSFACTLQNIISFRTLWSTPNTPNTPTLPHEMKRRNAANYTYQLRAFQFHKKEQPCIHSKP